MRMMRRYARAIVDRPRTVLLAVIAITLFLGNASLHLERALRMRDVLPSEHPNVRIYNRIDDLFHVEGNVLVAVRPHDGDVFQPGFLGVLAGLTHDLEQLPGIVKGSVLGVASKGVRRVVLRGDDLDVVPLLPELPADAASVETLRAQVLGSPLYRGLLVSDDRRWAAIVGATDGSVPLIEFRDRVE